jgi:phage-related protein
VLYFGAPSRSFVLLHAFAKHTDTTPERDIAIAEQRMADHVKRRTGRA